MGDGLFAEDICLLFWRENYSKKTQQYQLFECIQDWERNTGLKTIQIAGKNKNTLSIYQATML